MAGGAEGVGPILTTAPICTDYPNACSFEEQSIAATDLLATIKPEREMGIQAPMNGSFSKRRGWKSKAF